MLVLAMLFALPTGQAVAGEPLQDPSSPAAQEPAPVVQASPWFRDATEGSGVDFVHDWGATPERHLPETMGAGAAIFDANEDGWLDIYFVQGGPFPPGSSDTAPTNRLYLNQADPNLTHPAFIDATDRCGDAAHAGYGMAVTCGDANGDGHIDLFVTNFGPDVLLLGDGKGSFTDATKASGILDNRWTAGSVFFDADGDGDQDLYVTAYVQIDTDHPQWCGRKEEGWRSYCHPDHYEGLADRYWENQGDGTFLDRTEAAGLSNNRGKGLGVLAWDLDNDRDLDLYIANDSTENKLWRNDGRGHFKDDTLRSGTGVNANGNTEAGMGIAVGDIDHDGGQDILVTNFDDESNTLYTHHRGRYRERTLQSGLEAPSRLLVGFGTVLADFDHDTHLDLVVANGHIIHNIERYHDGKTHAQELQLFRGAGDGTFDAVPPAEAGDAFLGRYVGRGLYTGDLDNDGDLDLVLTQCGGPALILENLTPRRRGFVIRGLESGLRLQLNFCSEDMSRFYTVTEGAPSYFGYCARELHVAFGDVAVSDRGIIEIEGLSIQYSKGSLGSWLSWPPLAFNCKLGPDGKYIELK